METLKLRIDDSASSWYDVLMNRQSKTDFIFINDKIDETIWFVTNFMQYVISMGNHEVAPLYGKQISDLESLIYQVNLCLPVGYKLGTKLEALDDLLLNFETEPLHRFIIWNDCDSLLKGNRNAFLEVFESLVVAAYRNRNGFTTMKADGSMYKVDQRNFFIFNELALTEIQSLLDHMFFIPSGGKGLYKNGDFCLISLVG